MTGTCSDSHNPKDSSERIVPGGTFSEEQFRYFIKYCPNAAAIFDRDMVYLAWSDQHLRDFRVTEEQVIGKNHYDVFPELPRRFRDAHQRALHGFVEKNNNDSYMQADGSVRYTSWECRPWYDAEGEIGGMILYSENLTEQMRVLLEAKNQAEQEQAKWLTVLDHVSNGVVVCDASGNQIYANNIHAKMYGLKKGRETPLSREFITSSFVMQTYPNGEELAPDKWPAARTLTGEHLEGEIFLVKRRDRDFDRIMMFSGVPIYNTQGNVELAVMVSNDITEQIAQENQEKLMQERLQQTQRLESLGVLAGGIAHDFNNLLMAILGNADIALLKLAQSSPVAEHLGNIKSASMRAADLCTQLLAYSGQGKIEVTEFSISMLVREMTQMLKTSISKNCGLNLSLAERLPMTIGDSSQIRQILMNFVINASEAIGDRSGTINVTTSCMTCATDYFTEDYVIKPEKPGFFVTLEVSDNGSGMDKETLGHIFEPFFTTKFIGRGLGLSAVLGIIRAHDGGLIVTSTPGSGTTFKVFFPANSDCLEHAPCGIAGASAKRKHFSGKVLLVDDEEIVRKVCSSQLQVLGLEVLVASDGQEGVEVYREKQAEIDLVLLDLSMPKMGGEETFANLWQLNPKVTVVLASGYAEQDLASRFAGLQIAGYLRKPYTLEQLSGVLSGLLPEQR